MELASFTIEFPEHVAADDSILHCHVIFAGHIQHKQNASLIGLREGVA
jgi:hypothetical protein